MLAHHYSSALELDRAAGADTSALEEPARRALHEAGDRAFALGAYANCQDVLRANRRSVARERTAPTRSSSFATAACSISSTSAVRPEFLTQAVEIALRFGDSLQAAEAETLMSEMYWLIGRRDDAFVRV